VQAPALDLVEVVQDVDARLALRAAELLEPRDQLAIWDGTQHGQSSFAR
jgi:hypothetical protein